VFVFVFAWAVCFCVCICVRARNVFCVFVYSSNVLRSVCLSSRCVYACLSAYGVLCLCVCCTLAFDLKI